MSYSNTIATANTWEKYFLTSAKATESDKLIERITMKLSDGTTYPEAYKIFSQENSISLMNCDIRMWTRSTCTILSACQGEVWVTLQRLW